jgi:hypothetical protein
MPTLTEITVMNLENGGRGQKLTNKFIFRSRKHQEKQIFQCLQRNQCCRHLNVRLGKVIFGFLTCKSVRQ